LRPDFNRDKSPCQGSDLFLPNPAPQAPF